MMSASLACLRVHLALRGQEALAHHLGVAAATAAFFFVVHLDELTAERHHLVCDFGTRVVGAHDRAQVRRRADGREPGDARAGDEDLGRWDLAGGGNLAVEESAEGIGRLDHRAVAADAGHRGQRVHLLRAAQLSRQRVDGQHGGLARGQLLHQFGVLRRPDEADQGAAFAQQAHLLRAWRAHLEDDVAACPDFGGRAQHFGARRAVGVIGEVGGIATAAFHRHAEAQLDELFHHVGHGGDTLFAVRRFFRHSDAHGGSPRGMVVVSGARS